MEYFQNLAARNEKRAFEIINLCGIESAWKSIGAEVHLVGSLKMGLLMKHRDIDFHVYTKKLDVADSFRALARIAACPGIVRLEYANLAETDERCLEWHAWFREDAAKAKSSLSDSGSAVEWQIDMIQILKGSAYDGYFERIAERISAVLTPETRRTILKLKFDTPETEKIMGVEYYRAVLQGKVETWQEFQDWRKRHPVNGIVEWIP